MKKIEVISELEYALEQITQSRYVMQAAMEYFESTDELSRRALPYYADKIYSLLCSADTLLQYESKNIEECVQRAFKEEDDGQAD